MGVSARTVCSTHGGGGGAWWPWAGQVVLVAVVAVQGACMRALARLQAHRAARPDPHARMHPRTAGQCAKEIDKYCKEEEEGDGQLADCISNAIAQTELPGEGACLVAPTCMLRAAEVAVPALEGCTCSSGPKRGWGVPPHVPKPIDILQVADAHRPPTTHLPPAHPQMSGLRFQRPAVRRCTTTP